MKTWLIEFAGAIPCPVYVATAGCGIIAQHYVCDPWAAARFETEQEADDSIAKAGYPPPWHAVEHSFEIKCAHCGGDPGFIRYGREGFCNGCIPF